MIYFKETQYFYPLLTLHAANILITIILISLSENEGLMLSMLLSSAILTFFVYLTGKMSLCITDDALIVNQGFGFKTNKFLLTNIDTSSIAIENLPWWYGAGNKMAGKNITFFRLGFSEMVAFKEKNNNEKYYFSVKDKKKFILLLKEAF